MLILFILCVSQTVQLATFNVFTAVTMEIESRLDDITG